jgi:hypothetical protein
MEEKNQVTKSLVVILGGERTIQTENVFVNGSNGLVMTSSKVKKEKFKKPKCLNSTG